VELSTRGRYAVMAMVALAAAEAEPGRARPVTLAEIAARQCLSQCYLEQIFLRLRRGGLVVSARGPGGGYRLARPAATVTLAEVMGSADENLRVTRCTPDSAGCMAGPDGAAARCATHGLWEALGHHIQDFLAAVTLEDVVQGRFGAAPRPVPMREAEPA
jgi:Rrf2 family iron-sulfur cluster assembly transcriptional regulator